MTKNVKPFVQNCFVCAENNLVLQVKKGPMGPQQILELWRQIQIDYIGPLPQTAKGNKYCLVVVNSFTKWVKAMPTKNNTA